MQERDFRVTDELCLLVHPNIKHIGHSAISNTEVLSFVQQDTFRV